MKFDVLNRYSGAVQFTADIYCKEDESQAVKMGLAVKWAVKNKANLTRANLAGANLTRANLTEANLTRANLTRANLTWANLTEANLAWANIDFSAWPLWCGSVRAKIDERIARQLVYHALAVALPHMPAGSVTQELIDFANGFHRVATGDVHKLEVANG